MENNNICKFFVKNKNCKYGNQCKFTHDSLMCRNYFFDGTCNKNNCKFKHNYILQNNDNNINKNDDNNNNNIDNNNIDNDNNNNKDNKKYNKKKRPKNTENFNPSYKQSDMNILINKSLDSYGDNDIVIVPNFIKEHQKYDIYEKLLNEMDQTNINDDRLWKEWHGNNHLIADDNLNWKNKLTTFNEIIKKIEDYFYVDIKSTRFNLYEDSNDWKPFHHDAAAVKEHIAQNQNFTIGVSLGATRSIAFEHAKTKTTISIPLENGSAYAFSKNINVDWKHGIPQVHPDKAFSKGRISIIAWGKVNIDE
jgi:hypothetical protein